MIDLNAVSVTSFLRIRIQLEKFYEGLFWPALVLFWGDMIRSIQRYFYVKTSEIQQTIWQTAAILDSENYSCFYDVIDIFCNKILL